MPKFKVTIVVPKRDGFDGMWGAKMYFHEGVTADVVLDETQMADILPRPQMVVMQGGSQVTSFDQLLTMDAEPSPEPVPAPVVPATAPVVPAMPASDEPLASPPAPPVEASTPPPEDSFSSFTSKKGKK